MPTELPDLPPDVQSSADQFHAMVSDMLDRYVGGFRVDFNRHTVKHGPVPQERAVMDITRLFVEQVSDPESPLSLPIVAGVAAIAIVRAIGEKSD